MGLRRTALAVLLGAALAAVLACGKNPSGRIDQDQPNAAALNEAKDPSAKNGSGCEQCRARVCVGDGSQASVDMAAGCFQKPDSKHVPNPDPNFAQDCKAVVDCAFKHNCAYDPAKGPAHCYCGSRAVDECISEGPANDAPCVAEWTAATRGANNRQILERFSQLEYPSGWAFQLLECDRDQCSAKSTLGRCTP